MSSQFHVTNQALYIINSRSNIVLTLYISSNRKHLLLRRINVFLGLLAKIKKKLIIVSQHQDDKHVGQLKIDYHCETGFSFLIATFPSLVLHICYIHV